MKDNIYIRGLEIGYNNCTNGISFNEITDKLEIKENLSDEMFKFGFITWFYSNFYNNEAEQNLVQNPHGAYIHNGVISKLEACNDQKSYIKGESIQKYIDYLELKESRESSQTAKIISYISIAIAVLSIVIPQVINVFTPEKPQQVIVTDIEDAAKDDKVYKELIKLEESLDNAIIEFKKTKESTKSRSKTKKTIASKKIKEEDS